MRELDARFDGDLGAGAAHADGDAGRRGERRLHAADLTVTAFLFALCLSIVVNALALQARSGDGSPLPPHRPASVSESASDKASHAADAPKPAARTAASQGSATGGR